MLPSPSIADFRARFPEFANVPDATIQMALNDALTTVDERWIEADQVPAICYLAAHLLSVAGEPGRSNGDGSGSSANQGPVSSVKVGDVQVNYSGSVASSGASAWGDSFYALSRYGQYFLLLLRRNWGQAFAIGGGQPVCGYDPWRRPLFPEGWLG